MDDDFSFLTGGLGDLDSDGMVDFVEMMDELDTYDAIMNTNDDFDEFDSLSEVNVDLDDILDEDDYSEDDDSGESFLNDLEMDLISVLNDGDSIDEDEEFFDEEPEYVQTIKSKPVFEFEFPEQTYEDDDVESWYFNLNHKYKPTKEECKWYRKSEIENQDPMKLALQDRFPLFYENYKDSDWCCDEIFKEVYEYEPDEVIQWWLFASKTFKSYEYNPIDAFSNVDGFIHEYDTIYDVLHNDSEMNELYLGEKHIVSCYSIREYLTETVRRDDYEEFVKAYFALFSNPKDLHFSPEQDLFEFLLRDWEEVLETKLPRKYYDFLIDRVNRFPSLKRKISLRKFNEFTESLFGISNSSPEGEPHDKIIIKIPDDVLKGYIPSYEDNFKEYLFVSVRFDDNPKSYDYLCNRTDIHIGDVVQVETSRGIKDVTVKGISLRTPQDLTMPLEKYKSIIQ